MGVGVGDRGLGQAHPGTTFTFEPRGRRSERATRSRPSTLVPVRCARMRDLLSGGGQFILLFLVGSARTMIGAGVGMSPVRGATTIPS
jgi:hypothetical protein